MLFRDDNEEKRQQWLKNTLSALPSGASILDAGAGELKSKRLCNHLDYVSQDFCQYQGGGSALKEGLQGQSWDTSKIDIVSDIISIPVADASFDAILCTEVFEHIPDPLRALDEFSRILKPNGVLVLTAPFSSNVHMAPHYFCTGFSKYWYEHHLQLRGFSIKSLVANGNWHELLFQEITRLGSVDRGQKNWFWPLSYLYSFLGVIYFKLCKRGETNDLACFGWHCLAVKL